MNSSNYLFIVSMPYTLYAISHSAKNHKNHLHFQTMIENLHNYIHPQIQPVLFLQEAAYYER